MKERRKKVRGRDMMNMIRMYKTLVAAIPAAYLALTGCGAATPATTTTAERPAQECPPRLMRLAFVQGERTGIGSTGGIVAIFDSDRDNRPDYMELRLMAPRREIMPQPFMYGWDRNRDGSVSEEQEGEVLYDPAMDGLNGNEMTPAQFQEFQRRKRDQLAFLSSLESLLYQG